MNLEDVIDPEYGLQQDEWSLSKPRFGKEDQLEVFGWSGKRDYSKYYILTCDFCSQDSGLFGEGVFKSTRRTLTDGSMPCGCSQTRWTEEQFKTLCSRKADELGYTFIGWFSEYKGQKTKIRMLCSQHGEWTSGDILHLLGDGRGCPICKGGIVKPDNVMIESFLKSGQFPEGTEFWRSNRLNSRRERVYWYVFCPDCSYIGESSSSCLQRGARPCLCTQARQQQAYINWIVNSDNQAIALKFGIANIAKRRVYEQNNRCVYEVRNYAIYNFPTKAACLAAERECKNTLECGLLTQEEMADGFSETTGVLNLVRIKMIYEKHGGILLTEKKVVGIIGEFLN